MMRGNPDKIASQADKLTSSDNGGKAVTTSHSPVSPAEASSLVRKTPGVLGGDARIRDTRIAVWMLVRARQLGMTDEEIRNRYRPPLEEADLEAAWQYYNANKSEIDLAIAENEAD
jgi:uncharacterized protein (DUF433 family)